MKSVSIRYFASLREAAGQEGENIQTSAATYQDLYRELGARYGFNLPADMVQVAVNEEFSQLKHEIRDGDRIVFIPPVAGG